MSDRILVTGAAGFVGYHVADRLCRRGAEVLGIDHLSDYYDVSLKEARLAELAAHRRFEFRRIDLADRDAMSGLFAGDRFSRVVHLAAQPGIRHSIDQPACYIDSNVVGFANLLEGCRHQQTPHLIFASSSSVYGANTDSPYTADQKVDRPLNLYAATKKANELMAHAYSHLFGLPITGLRFFTVYGPWGRPDMAIYKFTEKILRGETIDVFNDGRNTRDFTFIDDITDALVGLLDRPPALDETGTAAYQIFNLGNDQPVTVLRVIAAIEAACGVKADVNLLPAQPGDMNATHADITPLRNAIGYDPHTTIEAGVDAFVRWYRDRMASAGG